MSRSTNLDYLYDLLNRLKNRIDGWYFLDNCHGRMNWPDRGLYFFFHHNEKRYSTEQLRLTRIGTHAVSEGSSTSLWNRLRDHRGAKRGTYEGGGNHRGSVFRKRVGEAIIKRDGLYDDYPDWGVGSSAGRERRLSELDLERQVSENLRQLPFLFVRIDDEPGPDSDRSYIERNAIALASNFQSVSIDPRNQDWLGHHSPVDEIRESGLWNINHVDKQYDTDFLDRLETYIKMTDPPI